MNDLSQINRNNAAAIQRCIPELLAKGHFVVEERSGLHFVGCENFSGEGARERAEAKLAELNASSNSTHGILHEPVVNIGGAGSIHAAINNDHLAQRFGLSA